MPKISKDSAAQGGDHGPVAEWSDQVDGYAVNFVEFREDMDHSPLLKGLPDDRCQCPHWGYVIEGSMTFRYADREEVYEAGDAYYAPPGHIPVIEAGTDIVEFSPTAEYGRTMEVVAQNLATQGA